MRTRVWHLAIVAYVLVYGILCVCAGFRTHFHVALNDFWGNLYMADHLDFRNPGSFFCGFFPFGYALLLKAVFFGNPIVSACIANVFFGGVLLGAVAWWGLKTIGPKWTLLTVAAVSIAPKMFEYITLPGPDIGAAALAVLGGVLLIHSMVHESPDQRSWKGVVLGGIFCGLSALMRYHCLVLAVGLVVSTALFSKSFFRHSALGFAGVFSVYALQMAVNILSGHGLFETSASFNAYKLVGFIDWNQISAVIDRIPRSVIRIFFSAPHLFISGYASALMRVLPYLIPSMLCVFTLKDNGRVRVHAAILTASFVYFVVVCWSSERVVIPVLPFVLYSAADFAKSLTANVRARFVDLRLEIAAATLTVCILLALQVALFVQSDWYIVKIRKNANDLFREVENELMKSGVTDPKEVFTSSFDFYLPRINCCHPYRSGGWLRYSYPEYRKKYPELSGRTMEVFLADCRAYGITHLVLDRKAYGVSVDLGRLYEGSIQPKGISRLAEISGFKVFKVSGDS